jgi:hypothetical protein
VTTQVSVGGKFRRLKDHVAKVTRFERELTCSDRDAIIGAWNSFQHLVPDNSPLCVDITDAINASTVGKPLSPLQVAGYFSYLCRLGLWQETARDTRVNRSIKRGSFTVRPEYSRDLINEIYENWKREREDERLRKLAHEQLRAARAAGRSIRIRSGDGVRSVVAQAPTAPRAPVPQGEEEYDIKWM